LPFLEAAPAGRDFADEGDVLGELFVPPALPAFPAGFFVTVTKRTLSE
jgi:hypothetical protein